MDESKPVEKTEEFLKAVKQWEEAQAKIDDATRSRDYIANRIAEMLQSRMKWLNSPAQ